MFVDLDNLKIVNDRHGHHAGDLVIKTAAQRLKNTIRSDDFVGRLGGDEFVVLLHGPLSHATLETIAARMHAELSEPMAVGDTYYTITASIGVAQLDHDETRDLDDILREADAAMYTAKMLRKGTHYS